MSATNSPDFSAIPGLTEQEICDLYMYWFRVMRNDEAKPTKEETLYFKALHNELYARGIPCSPVLPESPGGGLIAGLVDDVSNVRYASPGKIAFVFRGRTILITEPTDVLLVGYDEQAARWFVDRYWFILQFVPPTDVRLRE